MATQLAERVKREADQRAAANAARHESFLRYRRGYWAKMALGISFGALLIYLLVDVEPRHNGGSWYGYFLGTVATGLIIWLTLLGVRKRAMTPGKWSLKAWTSAHIYLGLSLTVIATLHAGFQLGWNVHTLAWVLMMIVILSGIFGIIVYGVIPRQLSSNRDESTEAQMLETISDIDRQLFDAAQPLDTESAAEIQSALDEDAFGGGVWRRITGKYDGGGTTAALASFRTHSGSGSHPQDELFDRLEALLSRKQAALARLRRHLRLKALLQIWLYFHVPLTFALLSALSAHIISVFFYW